MAPNTTSKNLIEEYCSQSSLHGLRYLTLDGSHWIRKLLWGLIVVMSLIFWIILSLVLLKKFSKTPTVTVVESTYHPTSSIDFPAVTVCNHDVVYQSQTGNVTDILIKRGYNFSMIDTFYHSILPGQIDSLKKLKGHSSEMHDLLEKIGYTLKRLLKSVAQPCGQMLAQCWWRSQQVPCHQAFRTVLIYQGYCCRFQLDYLRNNFKSDVPVLAAGSDKFRGLRVKVNATSYGERLATAKVFVSSPDRGLTIYDDPESVPAGVEMNIALEPFVIESSEEVKALDIASRQCLLKYELEKDSLYVTNESKSYDGCVSFGFHQELVQRCHCTLFYMNDTDPRELWSTYPECRTKDDLCLSEFGVEKLSSISSNISEKYKCYAACDEVDYDYTVDYVRRDLNSHNKDDVHTIVNVFLRERTCLKYRREVLFSWDQLLASLGGTFGLCLGGSIISIVELFCLLGDVTVAVVERWTAARKVTPQAVHRKNHDMVPAGGKLLYPRSEFYGGRF